MRKPLCNYEKMHFIKIRSVKIDSSDTEDSVIDPSKKTLTTESTKKHASINTETDQTVRSNSAIQDNLSSAPATSSTNCRERPLYSFTASTITVSRDTSSLSSANINHESNANSSSVTPNTIIFDSQNNPPTTNRLLSTQNVVYNNENQMST